MTAAFPGGITFVNSAPAAVAGATAFGAALGGNGRLCIR